jgi:putative transcriptional regulator
MSTGDDADALLAAWIEATVAPEAPPADLRRRLLASVAGPARFGALADALGGVTELGGAALGALLAKVDDAAAWSDAPFPGVRYFNFAPGPAAVAAGLEAGFVRLAPGARFPRHRHLGVERTFVLDGLLEDRGQTYGPGRVVEAAAGTEHDYAAGPGRDLVIVSLHGGFELLA